MPLSVPSWLSQDLMVPVTHFLLRCHTSIPEVLRSGVPLPLLRGLWGILELWGIETLISPTSTPGTKAAEIIKAQENIGKARAEAKTCAEAVHGHFHLHEVPLVCLWSGYRAPCLNLAVPWW